MTSPIYDIENFKGFLPAGDYIWCCGVCAHAIAGYSPEDVGHTAWPEGVAQGSLLLLVHMQKNKLGFKPSYETSDSNLFEKCGICQAPHQTGQYYELQIAERLS